MNAVNAPKPPVAEWTGHAPADGRPTLEEILKDELLTAMPVDEVPWWQEALASIDAGLERARQEGILEDYDQRESEEALADLLQLFTRLTNPKLVAYCYLMLINRCPVSEVKVAEECGVTKQAISKVLCRLESRYQMRARIGRNEEAREHARQAARINWEKRHGPEK